MTSCFNIQCATADSIKKAWENESLEWKSWVCGYEDDLIQDVIC